MYLALSLYLIIGSLFNFFVFRSSEDTARDGMRGGGGTKVACLVTLVVGVLCGHGFVEVCL